MDCLKASLNSDIICLFPKRKKTKNSQGKISQRKSLGSSSFLKDNSGRAGFLLNVVFGVVTAHGRTPSYEYSRPLFQKAFPDTRCIIFTGGAQADPILYNELEAEKADAIHEMYERKPSLNRKEFLECLRTLALLYVIWENRFHSMGRGFTWIRN